VAWPGVYLGGAADFRDNPGMTPVRRVLEPTVRGGLTAGALDAVLAVVLYRAAPVAVFHSIASGLLGRAAYEGGLATAGLGALLHFVIAFGAAATYASSSLALPILVRRAAPCGLAFGACVYFFMNYVVLPLSAVAFARPFSFALLSNGVWLGGLAGHMLLIGLPIALFTRRAAERPNA
jgi:hypothetical protein